MNYSKEKSDYHKLFEKIKLFCKKKRKVPPKLKESIYSNNLSNLSFFELHNINLTFSK